MSCDVTSEADLEDLMVPGWRASVRSNRLKAAVCRQRAHRGGRRNQELPFACEGLGVPHFGYPSGSVEADLDLCV